MQISSERKILVELIGPPGIGKTTLIKQLKKHKAIRSLHVPRFLTPEVYKYDDESTAPYGKLFHFATSVKNNKSLKRFQYLLNWLYRDMYIKSELKAGHVYLTDEGLGHHFTTALLKLYEHDKQAFAALMQNRCFILLSAPSKTIVERIHLRKNQGGKILPQHENANEEHLKQSLDKRLEKMKILCSKASEAGSRYLELDAEEDISENMDIIIAFLSGKL